MALTTIKSSNLAPGSIEISDLEDSGVTAQSYGSASEVPVITVNAKGVITAATTTTVAGVTDFDYNIATGVLDIDTADGSNFSTTVTLGPFDTDDLSEGSSNLYYTDSRVSNYLTTNSYATSSDITTAINNLIDSAPGTLDTLNELAASLGDDADFAGTMTTSLAGKVDKINITGATVGSGTAIPVITYNAQGQITSATTTNVTIGDATLTVSSGSGLTGSGTFTANATSNGTITLSHDDTSTLSGSYGQTSTEDGTYIKSITVDGFGHLTAVTTDDFDDRYLGINAKAADSDLLDGISSASFLRSDANDSHSGTITLTLANQTPIVFNRGADNNYTGIKFTDNSADRAWIGLAGAAGNFINQAVQHDFAIRSQRALHLSAGGASAGLTLDSSNNVQVTNTLYVGGTSNMFINYDQIYRPNNGRLAIQYSGSGNTTICVGGGNVGIGTDSPNEKLEVATAGTTSIRVSGGDGNSQQLKFYSATQQNASIYSYYNLGSPYLALINNGSERMRIDSSGHVLPGADATQDLGSSSYSWRNIYTNDLHLSNEGHEEGNSVDGTKGNWTIQEGEDHLYIINNKNGKKFKFSLEEVE